MVYVHVLLRASTERLVRTDDHARRVRELLDRCHRPDVWWARGTPASVSQEQHTVAVHEDGLVARRHRHLPRVSESVIDLDEGHQASYVDHASIMPLESMTPEGSADHPLQVHRLPEVLGILDDVGDDRDEAHRVVPLPGHTTSARRHHATVADAPSAATNGTTVSHTGATGSIPASVPMAHTAATDQGHQVPAPATIAT